VPLAFPSHQGLIAPLWRRWPERFNVLALCIGAAMPDVVDGVAGAFRGHLGQWYGHSLIGLFAFCLPAGLLLTWLVIALGKRLTAPADGGRGAARNLRRLGRGMQQLGSFPEGLAPLARLRFSGFSVFVGALSHLVLDFISHGGFFWLYPWHANLRLFPSWWYARWFEIPLPGYAGPYPAGPHLLVWVLLSVVGIAMLFLPRRSPSGLRQQAQMQPLESTLENSNRA